MFLTGGLPTDSPSPKIEKGSYSERYPFPDWRGNVTARKLIKKKQYKGGMFTPLPDTSFFAMRLRNPEEAIKLRTGVHGGLLPIRNTGLVSQTNSKLAQSIPEEAIKLRTGVHGGLLPIRNTGLASQTANSKLAQSIPDSITISTAKNIETTAKKTNIFKSVVKFFTKLFKKTSKV